MPQTLAQSLGPAILEVAKPLFTALTGWGVLGKLDKWFNRAPKIWELSGTGSKFSAPERVREFLRLRDQGQTPKRVVSVATGFKVDWSAIDKINKKRMIEVQTTLAACPRNQPEHVRFRGQSGHQECALKCPLMTQSRQ